MLRKLTITVEEEVYRGLHATVGRRRISRFVNDLVKPFVSEDAILASYRAQAEDEEEEAEALVWSEETLKDLQLDD